MNFPLFFCAVWKVVVVVVVVLGHRSVSMILKDLSKLFDSCDPVKAGLGKVCGEAPTCVVLC